jgi:hypothetical protein
VFTLYGIKFGDSLEDAEEKLKEKNPNFEFVNDSVKYHLSAIERVKKEGKIEDFKYNRDQVKNFVKVYYSPDKKIYYIIREQMFTKPYYPSYAKLKDTLFSRFGNNQESSDIIGFHTFTWQYDINKAFISSRDKNELYLPYNASNPFWDIFQLGDRPRIFARAHYLIFTKIYNPHNYLAFESGHDEDFVSYYGIYMMDINAAVAAQEQIREEEKKRSEEIKGNF